MLFSLIHPYFVRRRACNNSENVLKSSDIGKVHDVKANLLVNLRTQIYNEVI